MKVCLISVAMALQEIYLLYRILNNKCKHGRTNPVIMAPEALPNRIPIIRPNITMYWPELSV